MAPAPSWVQSEHAFPPVPQFAVSVPVWHIMLVSQQPDAQLVESHVAPLLPPPLLEVDVPPPSSPLPLLLATPLELLPYPLDPAAELDELVPDDPPPLDPLLVLSAPEDEALNHLPSSAGSGADVAQAAAATAPTMSITFAGVPEWRLCISDSLRGPSPETTQYDPVLKRL